MLARLTEVIALEARAGRAVAAFTCYDVSTALGVLDAAEGMRRPVVLLMAERSLMDPSGERLAAALMGAAARSRTPVAVQADHLRSIDQARRAFDFGIQAVMFDGSRLPFEANQARTREVQDIAHQYQGDVEAELGRIEGAEDTSSNAASGAPTDPVEAARYVSGVPVACLAISIGNVHGEYRRPPQLDWLRLQALASACAVPLSLHGSSGLSRSDARRTIELGIQKLNVNTDLRIAVFRTLEANLSKFRQGYRLADLNEAVMESVRAAAWIKLVDFDPTIPEGSEPTYTSQ